MKMVLIFFKPTGPDNGYGLYPARKDQKWDMRHNFKIVSFTPIALPLSQGNIAT